MKSSVLAESIVNKIIELRGENVLVDKDIAELYGVETKQLKRVVRRNIDRFPEDFMFELSKAEYQRLKRQRGALKRGRYSKYPPMAFTKQGVAMLSSVLNIRRANKVNILIMRVFVKLRETTTTHKKLTDKLSGLEQRIEGHDEQIRAIFEAIQKLVLPDDSNAEKKIGFTVKEKQKQYVKTKTATKAPDDFSLTPRAQKIWDTIPGDIKVKILNNVWCVNCTDTTGISNVSGKVEKGLLVLNGRCTRCGGPVARVIENE